MSVADTLIPIINSLQDVFSTLPAEKQTIDLPQITVVGSQSAGKSSVLEAICGRDILPRGSGIVTRRPLIMQLNPSKGRTVKDENGKEVAEWGEFLHSGDKIFAKYEDICKEIVDETDRLTGNSKNISSVPIRLKLYAPTLIPLTMVDLPGLVKNALPGQPPDIDVQIQRCVYEYIGKPNSIILAVSAANADLATSDALDAARKVDPEGNRTVGVLTKVDIIDKGTEDNIVKILKNEDYHLKLGWIAVVNRSQKDIDNNKPINKHLKDEAAFFAGSPYFREIASSQGIPVLTRRLNQVLINHIQMTLPDLKMRIQSQLDKYNKELMSYGNMPEDQTQKERLLLSMITQYDQEYKSMLDGTSAAASRSELVGGARIGYIFTVVLPKMFDTISINDLLNGEDVRTLIKNSNGTRSGIFLSESAFELLVVKIVRKLEGPCKQCVMLVRNELIQIAKSIPDDNMKRYGKLCRELVNTCCGLIDDCARPTTKFLQDMITAELSYINTNHPDFIQSNEFKDSINSQRGMADMIAPGDNSSNPFGPSNGPNNGPNQFGAPMGAPMGAPNQMNRPNGPQPMGAPQQNRVQPPNMNRPGAPNMGPNMQHGPNQQNPNGSVQPQGQTPPPGQQQMQQGPPAGFVPNQIKAAGPLTQSEKMGVEIIPRLMKAYYVIIRKKVEDTVPKAIMAFLIKASKDQLQETLVRRLYSSGRLDELLFEDPIVREKRAAAREMVGVLSRGAQILDRIGDIRSIDDMKKATAAGPQAGAANH